MNPQSTVTHRSIAAGVSRQPPGTTTSASARDTRAGDNKNNIKIEPICSAAGRLTMAD